MAVAVAPAAPKAPQAGFSLIEVMVAVGLMSVLLGFGIGSWKSWMLAEAHKGTATSIQSALRNAQVRAVTEGVSMCVSFDTVAHTYTLSRYACDTSTVKLNGPIRMGDPRVKVSTPVFTAPDGSTMPAVTFRPTGSAWPGTLRVVRDGSPKIYEVRVEGFTGRVGVQ